MMQTTLVMVQSGKDPYLYRPWTLETVSYLSLLDIGTAMLAGYSRKKQETIRESP